MGLFNDLKKPDATGIHVCLGYMNISVLILKLSLANFGWLYVECGCCNDNQVCMFDGFCVYV